jgi:plasmid maintenance system antidote protein VapI
MTRQIKNQHKTERMRPIHPGEVLREEFFIPTRSSPVVLSSRRM